METKSQPRCGSPGHPANHARLARLRCTRLRATRLRRSRVGRQGCQHHGPRRTTYPLAEPRQPAFHQGSDGHRRWHHQQRPAPARSDGQPRRPRSYSRRPRIPRHLPLRKYRVPRSPCWGPAIAATLTAGGAEMRTGDLIALVERGNPDAVAAIRQAGRDLGEVLATCVSLLNPSVIVLGGSLAAAGDHLLAGVREVVYNRSLPLATAHHCTVSVSRRRRHPRCLDAGRAACALRRCDRDRAGAAGLTLYLTLHRKPDSTQPPARATRAEFCRSNAGKMSVTAVGHRRGQCLGRQ